MAYTTQQKLDAADKWVREATAKADADPTPENRAEEKRARDYRTNFRWAVGAK